MRLEGEILILSYQLMILRRKAPTRLWLSVVDRFIFVSLYQLRPSIINVTTIARSATHIDPVQGDGIRIAYEAISLNRPPENSAMVWS
jgi:hypothetical protein